MIDIIDRQVDRDQARRRSSDITKILRNVSYESLSSRVHPFCLQVMQNVPEDELEILFRELEVIKSSDDLEDSKKLAIGLLLYNIVGKKLFASIISDLNVEDTTKKPNQNEHSNDTKYEFNQSFGEIVDEIKQNGN